MVLAQAKLSIEKISYTGNFKNRFLLSMLQQQFEYFNDENVVCRHLIHSILKSLYEIELKLACLNC